MISSQISQALSSDLIEIRFSAEKAHEFNKEAIGYMVLYFNLLSSFIFIEITEKLSQKIKIL